MNRYILIILKILNDIKMTMYIYIPIPMADIKEVDILSTCNIFNSKDENKSNTLWRNLSNEERIERLNSYFKSEFNHDKTEKTINNSTIYMLIELASKGKLKLKKEIKYDKVNERIWK